MKMRIHLSWLCFCLTLFFVLPFLSQEKLYAGDNDIDFTAKIVDIKATSSTSAKLTVSLFEPPFDTIQTTVLVNSFTRVTAPGDVKFSVSDFTTGQFVEVEGVFTSGGIAATRLEVEAQSESQNEFRLRGTLDNVVLTAGTGIITVGGVNISVQETTQIQLRELGPGLSFLGLSAGTQVDVRGSIQNSQLIATHIETGSKLHQSVDLDFHGTITAMSGNQLTIQIEQKPSIVVTVQLNSQSEVRGALVTGAEVEVKGSMATDFTITAQQIEVAGAAEAEGGIGSPE